MVNYIARRVGFLFLTLLLTAIVSFTTTQFLSGDIARNILGREAGDAAVASLREELGLNEPPPVQYVRWLGNFVNGDWGRSFS